MTARRLIGLLGIVVWGAIGMVPMQGSAAAGSETLADIRLDSAGDLVATCTVAPVHDDYAASLGFCYGFFEGAIRYHQAISGSNSNKHLVCAPTGTTRLQGVEVFIDFMQEHPEYESEASIDTVFRALIARWPCAE